MLDQTSASAVTSLSRDGGASTSENKLNRLRPDRIIFAPRGNVSGARDATDPVAERWRPAACRRPVFD
jgi:hypothetical protein